MTAARFTPAVAAALALGAALPAAAREASLPSVAISSGEEGPADVCAAPFHAPAPPVFDSEVSDPRAVDIAADDMQGVRGDLMRLRGDVHVRRGTVTLAAEQVTYNEGTEVIEAQEGVRIWEPRLFVEGRRARINVADETSEVEGASFVRLDSPGRGEAESMRTTGRNELSLSGARYTTCAPEDEAWVLEAATVDLDNAANEGVARNVWVNFYGVPLFYTPYLSFPLGDERKSGLLPPRVGVSGATGFDVTVPYYFNLAPNYDATAFVRTMFTRGVQLAGEFRYLTELGRGELSAEYLPHDSDLDDDRTAVRVVHDSDFGNRWYAGVNFSWVSDRDYFDDLGTNLALSSRRFLRRDAEAGYRGDGWFGLARVRDYQLLDDDIRVEDEPYKTLPQLLLATAMPERNAALNFDGAVEAAYFDRDDSVTGARLDAATGISFPLRRSEGFIVPRVEARVTQYALDDTAPGQDSSVSRFVPSISLDGGLNFERELFDGGYVHTFEPRLFYLYRPFDDQDNIPIFDTGEYTFSYQQLFRGDRFSGVDRLGDANQLAIGVDSRLLSTDDGAELARLSVGQIRYFRDRKVNLPGVARDTDTDSDLIGEAQVLVNRAWRVRGGLQWNASDEQTNRSTLGLQFRPDDRRVLNAAYRFLRESPDSVDGSIEQIDVSAVWPVAQRWRAVGRYNFAISRDTTLEAFAGIEYESCCWSLRLVGRRYLTDNGNDHTSGVFAQLELHGLTGVGRGASDFLERNVPGYENEF